MGRVCRGTLLRLHSPVGLQSGGYPGQAGGIGLSAGLETQRDPPGLPYSNARRWMGDWKIFDGSTRAGGSRRTQFIGNEPQGKATSERAEQTNTFET